MLKIHYRDGKGLSDDEWNRVRRLHIRDGTGIGAAKAVRNGTDPGWFMLARKDRKIVGWLLCVDLWNYKDWHFMLYVNRKYRRQGIGSAMITEAKAKLAEKAKVAYVQPWNDDADGFFNANGWPKANHRWRVSLEIGAS